MMDPENDIATTCAGDTENGRNRFSAFSGLALAAIVLLAVGLRAYNLDAQSVWYDECQSISRLNEPGLIAFLRAERSQDWYMVPLYFVLQYAWAHTVGDSATAIRWLGILFGVASIPLLYATGRFLFGRAAGLTAALCMALSPAHLFLAQEIRPYALMNLLVLVSAGAFLQALRKGGRRWWMLHLGANFLLIWTHLFGAFFIMAQGAYLLARRNGKRKAAAWAAAHVLLLLPTVFWVLSVNRSFAGKEEAPAAWRIVGNAFGDCMPRNSPAYMPEDRPWENAPPAWTRPLRAAFPWFDHALFLFFTTSLLWFLGKQILRHKRSDGAFLLYWLFLPCLCLFFVARLWRPDAFAARYTSYCPLALYLIVGAFLAGLPRRTWRVAAIALLVVLYGHRLTLALASPQRTDWLAARKWILESGAPAQPIIVYPPGYHFECIYNWRPERRSVSYAAHLEHLCDWTEKTLSREPSAWIACVGLAGTDELAARFERYLAARTIPHETKGYWAFQLPYLIVYRLFPPEKPATADAIASAIRAATEEFDAEQARLKAARDARAEGLALLRAGSHEAGWEAFDKAFATLSWDEEAYVALAMSVQKAKQGYPRLVSAARAYAETHPNDPRPHADLGFALAAEGDDAGAEAAFRKAIERDPANQPAACRALLELLRRRKDTRGSLDVAMAAARNMPSESVFASQAVLLALELEDWDTATAAYELLLNARRSDPFAFEQLARALMTKKRDPRQVIELARRTIAVAPKQAGAHAALGTALMETGLRDEAFDAFWKAAACDPEIDPAIHRYLADIAWERNDYAAAAKAAARGLRHAQGDAALASRLAQALCKQGKWKDARALVEKETSPETAPILFGIVANALLWEKKDFTGGIAFTRAYLERFPNDAGAQAILGMALRHENDMEGALAALRKAIELAPGASPWTYGNLALVLLERADAAGAVEAARQGIALLPTDSFLYDVLAQALCRMGEHTEAVEAARKAVELNPRIGSPPWTLAMALLGAGRQAEAITAAKQAFDLDGGLADTYRTLFTLAFEKPDPAAARQEMRRLRRANIAMPHELMKAVERLPRDISTGR
ncbi:MAG TPA: glycosyltransferase family 39 protein [Candidatus Hydrogenedentes bacterium]|nr:glycosyltransferase family 39 protein [Candidatus Hydrogenedentota bacterium]HRT20738.1 glycosyltransferase family 39 protein [Candidatus Hydrogenedentota bacterium]HRT66013.1 glycosyltransferase family 39 protein [Candidatus Hydrogenedentota bacterium]